MPSCLDSPTRQPPPGANTPATQPPAPVLTGLALTILAVTFAGLAWLYAVLDTSGLFVHQMSGETAFLVIGFACACTGCAFVGATRWSCRRDHKVILDRIDQRHTELVTLIEGACDYFTGYADGYSTGVTAQSVEDDDPDDDRAPASSPVAHIGRVNGYARSNGHAHQN
jgi:hypothetical protein